MRLPKSMSISVVVFALFQGCTSNPDAKLQDQLGENGYPTPAALFARHIEAIGGEEAIRAHSSRTIKGNFSMPALGVEGALLVVAAAPNKVATSIDLGAFGSSAEGFDGTVGWSINPMTGIAVLNGEMLEAAATRADFYADLHLGSRATTQQTLDIAMIDGNEAFRVRLENGGRESFLYFSTDTGLLVGRDSIESTAQGKLPTTTRLREYVEFGGQKVASHSSTLQGGIEAVIEIDSVVFDNVDDKDFELPSEIKALVQ
jgi:hypothetical protein